MTLHVLHLGRDGVPLAPATIVEPVAGDPFAGARLTAFVDSAGFAAGSVSLQGRVTVDRLGRSEAAVVGRGRITVAGETFAAGSAFVMAAGFLGEVTGEDDAVWFFTAEPARPAAEGTRLVRLDPDLPRPASNGPPAEVLIGPKPSCHALNQFTGPGAMRAGVWDVMTACERSFVPHRIHELMHLIAGEVTLTHRDGTTASFRAGDTLLVPQGAPYAWKNTIPVVKFYTVSA